MKLRIKPGKRYTIIGRTGSGKSVLMMRLIESYTQKPIVILNSKEDGDISALADGKNGVEVNNVDDMLKAVKDRYEYVIITPPTSELDKPEILDNYILQMYLTNRPHLFVIDELYMIHNNNRAYQGLLALLTRGRSKKMSYIGCVQRPAGISRTAISEADEFFIFRLKDNRDKKVVWDIGLDMPENIEQYCFYHSDGETSRVFAPIPFAEKPPEPEYEKTFNKPVRR